MTNYFRCASCGGINRVPDERLGSKPTCGRCKAALDVSGHPQEVSDDELERLVRASPVPVLVDFWAPWCGPCRAVAPQLESLGRDRAGRLIIAKVNTDQHSRTAQRLGVRAIPTLAIWKGGELVHSQSGAIMRPHLDAFVDRYGAGSPPSR